MAKSGSAAEEGKAFAFRENDTAKRKIITQWRPDGTHNLSPSTFIFILLLSTACNYLLKHTICIRMVCEQFTVARKCVSMNNLSIRVTILIISKKNIQFVLPPAMLLCRRRVIHGVVSSPLSTTVVPPAQFGFGHSKIKIASCWLM